MTRLRIAVIGTGRLGSVLAYRIATTGLARELYLIDVRKDVVWGVAEDIRHSLGSSRRDVDISWSTRAEDASGMDVVLITAGKPRVPGVPMTREALAEANARIIRDIALALREGPPGSVYVIITNPVDIMASLFLHYNSKGTVISSGCSLDSARLRWFTSAKAGVGVGEVTGYVIGSHGQVQGIAESLLYIRGVHARDFFGDKYGEFIEEARRYVGGIAKKVIDSAGATIFGPVEVFTRIVRGLAGGDIVESIGLPYAAGEYRVFVSVPALVSGARIEGLEHLLSSSEKALLNKAINHVYTIFTGLLNKLGEGG